MENFQHPVYFNKDVASTWAAYYTRKSKQGSGIPGYSGDVFLRGHGFWGDLWKMSLPIVRYLGKQTASTLVRTGSDVLEGENIIHSLKKQAKNTAKNIVDDVAAKAGSAILGKGRKYKRKRKSKQRTIKKRKSLKKRSKKHLFI